MFISSAIAQTAPAAATGGGDMMSSLTGMLPLVLMFVVLYFVMIRPQMKRQKEHRAMIDAIAKGDVAVAKAAFVEAQSELMRAVSKGVVHPNTGSRKVSRLAARLKKLDKAAA